MILSSHQLKKITDVLKKYPTQAAFLFGSQASGHAHALSDLDLAVLFVDMHPDVRRTALLKMHTDIADVIGKMHLDLIDLADAPPLLQMNIFISGRKLFDLDPSITRRSILNAVKHYEDFSFHLNQQVAFAKRLFV